MTDKKKTTQYITRVQIKNFRKIKMIDFRPNRYITQVSGANGAGKTSAFDALQAALDGDRKTIDPKELRSGERSGGVYIETNTHNVKRTMDERGGSVNVEAKDSNTLVKDPVAWLAEVGGGNLGFDPLAFMRMKGDEQAEQLKAIIKLDADLDGIEEKNAEDLLIIRARKIQKNDLEAQRDGTVFDSLLPTEPIDINELLKESRAVAEHNQKIEEEQRDRADKKRCGEEYERISRAKGEEIEQLRERIQKLTIEAREADNAASDLLGELERADPLPEKKDRKAIDDRISEASATNSRITGNNAARDQRTRLEAQISELDTQVKNLKSIVDDRKQTAARALETAAFPIPGLSFVWQTEGSNGQKLKNPKRIVTYHGLPLEDASTGEQIRVSAAIGMAGKPELRFMLIREGSLLDDAGMAILEKMAHENEWQILVEMVDTTGTVGIYLEDGEIKAINEEPEPAAVAPKRRATKKKAAQSKMNYGDEKL